MNDIVRDIFKDEFEQAEAVGVDRGKEEMVEEMLKDNEPAKKIAKWSGMSMDRIAEIAEKIGISSLIL